ncbi:hypothetical protein [Pantoea vagans]|uniref:hypothetical protein n=1 Tax=Pantoea vagans TaxID=470934 RepID=UPI00076B8A1A|nr:hypothetical protein [Pantoea vagans]AMG58454.1 hypothetical protein AL522_12875 [Pantoea vagans]
MLIYQVYEQQFMAYQMSGFRKEGCFIVNADVYFPAKQPPCNDSFSDLSAIISEGVDQYDSGVTGLRNLLPCPLSVHPIADDAEDK